MAKKNKKFGELLGRLIDKSKHSKRKEQNWPVFFHLLLVYM